MRHDTARLASRPAFYLGTASVLLAIVLVGFSPTFYLRTAFDVRPISTAAWAHGSVMTTWFVGFAMQATLVTANRRDLHRRLGWLLAALALAVVATSLTATLGLVPTMRANLPPDVVLAIGPGVLWGNLATVVAFPALLGAALRLRRNAAWHKRLMLLASIGMIGPAFARIFQWSLFGTAINANFFVYAILGSFALIAVVAIYDLATIKRIHPATLLGGTFLIAIRLLSVLVIARTELGQSLVRALS